MGAALIALVSAGLSLSGFGIDANPNAPSGNEVVGYAPDRADFMVHLDLEAVAPKNYDALKRLSKSNELRILPDVQRELKSLVGQIEMGLGMARGAIGIDPIRDVKSVTAWVRFPARGQPKFMVRVRGRFPADLIDKVAASAGRMKTVKVRGRTAILKDDIMLASAPDGSLLFGTPALVRRRAERGPRRGRRGAHARAARVLDARPFFAITSAPSKVAIARIGREMSGSADNALADLISGHRFAAVSLSHNGVRWVYNAYTGKGAQRAEVASKGLLQLMRASHYAGRGLANLFFASIDSYRGKDRELDTIIKVKRDLLKLVDEFTGDGKFVENVRYDRRSKTVTVTATGRSLSDVMPLVGLAPLAAGWGYFMVSARADSHMDEAKSARPAGPRKPRPRKTVPHKRVR